MPGKIEAKVLSSKRLRNSAKGTPRTASIERDRPESISRDRAFEAS